MSASNSEALPDECSSTLQGDAGRSGNTDFDGIRELLAMIERTAHATPSSASFPLFTHGREEPQGPGSESRARLSRSRQGAVQLIAPLPLAPLRLGAVVPRDQLSPFERRTAVSFSREASTIPARQPLSRTIRLWSLAAAAILAATVGSISGVLALWIHSSGPAEQAPQRAPMSVRGDGAVIVKEDRGTDIARSAAAGSGAKASLAEPDGPDDLDLEGGSHPAAHASHLTLGIRIRSRTGVPNYPDMRIDQTLVADASFEFLRFRNLPTASRVSQGLNTSPGNWVLAKSQLPRLIIWLPPLTPDDTTIILDLLRMDGSIIASLQHQLAMTIPGDQVPGARP